MHMQMKAYGRLRAISARFNGNAMGMARGARFILGRGFLSWGPLGPTPQSANADRAALHLCDWIISHCTSVFSSFSDSTVLGAGCRSTLFRGNMSYHDPESHQTKRRRVRSRARGHVDYIFQEHAADTESETESILML